MTVNRFTLYILHLIIFEQVSTRVKDRVEFHEDEFAAVDGPATIRCHASNSLPVLWEFRSSTDRNVHHVYDRQLTSSYEHRCTINESTYDLTIHKTQFNDIGEYLCIESEGFGTKHVTKLYLTVTPMYFENDSDVREVLVHGTVTLPCKTSAHSTVVWQHQQFCDNFEHGMYICSNPVEVAIGNQYQIHRNASGENSLAINYVTKDMTGLYMCKDRDSDVIHYKVLLNVITLVVPAYVGQIEQLPCGVMENIPPDWMYQETENAQRHKISVNGSLESDHDVWYTLNGSSLIINEVTASDAGIYLCGRGSQLYHKLQLNVFTRPMTSTSLSGYPGILVCSQKPTVPVSWTFRHFANSEVENIITNGSVVNGYSERFGILGTSLIIYKVQQSDDGLYNCSDANGNVFTHNFTVSEEPLEMPEFCSDECYWQIVLLSIWCAISTLVALVYTFLCCYCCCYISKGRRKKHLRESRFIQMVMLLVGVNELMLPDADEPKIYVDVAC